MQWSIPADSSLPTSFMVNSAFGANATIMSDAAFLWPPDAIGPPPDPASAEPRFGNYRRTQNITRPPSASRRWGQGLITIWPQFRTRQRFRPSFKKHPANMRPYLHTVRRVVVKPAVHRRKAGMGPRLACRPPVARNPGTDLTIEGGVITRDFLKRCG